MVTIEEGIEILLKEVDKNCKIVRFEEIKAEDRFALVLRTKFPQNEAWAKSSDGWIGKFGVQTNSKWIVKTTCPKPQRIAYRKVYVCKENSASKRDKNLGCGSRVDIKVKKTTVFTTKKDKLLKDGFNAEIKVIFDHTHERN